MAKRDLDVSRNDEIRGELDEKAKSLARAEARAREINIDNRMKPGDTLYFPPEKVPYGWVYRWIRISMLGIPDPDNERFQIIQRGWTPVPADRHPEEAGHHLYKNDEAIRRNVIIRKGQMLCEMPEISYRGYMKLVHQAAYEDVRSLKGALGEMNVDPTMRGEVFENTDDYSAQRGRAGGRSFGY